jgi:hypothetical protein
VNVEYHRTESGGTVVCKPMYAPRATRCADDWKGRYADGSPKANRQPCLFGVRIERGQPCVEVCVDDNGLDNGYRRYHAECYMRSYRVVDRV